MILAIRDGREAHGAKHLRSAGIPACTRCFATRTCRQDAHRKPSATLQIRAIARDSATQGRGARVAEWRATPTDLRKGHRHGDSDQRAGHGDTGEKAVEATPGAEQRLL